MPAIFDYFLALALLAVSVNANLAASRDTPLEVSTTLSSTQADSSQPRVLTTPTPTSNLSSITFNATTTNALAKPPSAVAIMTGLNGVMVGRVLKFHIISYDDEDPYDGDVIPITTTHDAALASEWNSLLSSVYPEPPGKGECKVVIRQAGHMGGDDAYCLCASKIASKTVSKVPMAIAVSLGTLTTVCKTATSLPTPYIEVPKIGIQVGNPNQIPWTKGPFGDCVDGSRALSNC